MTDVNIFFTATWPFATYRGGIARQEKKQTSKGDCAAEKKQTSR